MAQLPIGADTLSGCKVSEPLEHRTLTFEACINQHTSRVVTLVVHDVTGDIR